MIEKITSDDTSERSLRTENVRKQAMKRVLLFRTFRETYPENDFGGDDGMTPEQEATWKALIAEHELD